MKNLSKLNGAKALSKSEQMNVFGGKLMRENEIDNTGSCYIVRYPSATICGYSLCAVVENGVSKCCSGPLGCIKSFS